MRIERFYESGWTVYRKAVTQDAAGGVTETYSTHLTVDGRMRPLTGSLRLSADKDTYFGDHRFYCDVVDILEGDQLANSGSTGTVYDVKNVSNMMHFDKFLQIDCELIR